MATTPSKGMKRVPKAASGLHFAITTGAIRTPTPSITILSILVFVDAFIWLVGVVPTLYYAFTRGKLPTLAGIRLLGGPFEKLGLEMMIPAGILYVMVSALKIFAAYWLRDSRMDGAVLVLVLLGLSVIFWYGFALPLGPPIGILQVVLLALAWRNLR